MKSEPSVLITAVTALLTTGIGLAVAFGADISEEQRNAILAAGGALVAVILALGPIIRSFVVSPETAANAVIMAKQDVAPTRDVPAINGPAGGAYADVVTAAGFHPTPPPAN